MPRQTRRGFLRDAAMGGAGLVILSSSRSARAYAANEKLNIALIGVGGRGKWYADVMPKQANLVALCDVNDSKAQAAYRAMPTVPKYNDFRKLLDERHKEIDGVMRGRSRPHACRHHGNCSEGRQARVLRKTIDRLHPRGPRGA